VFFFVRQYEELSTVAEETKKNFAAYERDDLKLREVKASCTAKQNMPLFYRAACNS
jgi:hypothetical protein